MDISLVNSNDSHESNRTFTSMPVAHARTAAVASSALLAAVSAPHEDPWREATALHFATAFQADREVVLAAVQQNGEALTYASQELQAKLLLKCR